MYSSHKTYDIVWIFSVVEKDGSNHSKKSTQPRIENGLSNCLAINGVMKTTPTVSLEALLGLFPLYIEVKAHTRITFLRQHFMGN